MLFLLFPFWHSDIFLCSSEHSNYAPRVNKSVYLLLLFMRHNYWCLTVVIDFHVLVFKTFFFFKGIIRETIRFPA